MKEIKLTRNQVALVDDDDYEWLNQWKWQARWSAFTKTFYAQRTQWLNNPRRSTYVAMHRLILGLTERATMGDHKNGDTLDNRRRNLRVATRAQNASNSRTRRDSISKIKGVCFHKRLLRYQAHITVAGKNMHLGTFDTVEEATLAYKLAATKYHGEYART